MNLNHPGTTIVASQAKLEEVKKILRKLKDRYSFFLT